MRNKDYIMKNTNKSMKKIEINGHLYYAFFTILSLFICMGVSGATTERYEVNIQIPLVLSCTINNAIPSAATTMNLTITYPNGTIFKNNVLATPKGNGVFNYTTTFPVIGTYHTILVCIDGANSNSDSSNTYEITPNGKEVTDVGQISTGLLYFYIFLAVIFIGLGYLFLMNSSLWVSYSGLFLMAIGFTFVYYDLHLSNVYANTIAVNSGAGNVATGAFRLATKFLKVAPYIIALVIGFSAVKVLRASINKKKKSDGWDNNQYDK